MQLNDVLGALHEVNRWVNISPIFLHLIGCREPTEEAIAEEEV